MPRKHHFVHNDIDRILLHRDDIARRVQAMGEQIAGDLDEFVAHPAEIVLVPILTGSMIFLADLVRHLPHRLRIGVVSVSSYPGMSVQSKGALLRSAIPDNLKDKHVLIVDDILDSGQTLHLIESIVREQEPADVRKCVLLRKDCKRAVEVDVEYVGFDIPDEFVVGYGLDYDDFYRNLPDIGILRQSAIATESESDSNAGP